MGDGRSMRLLVETIKGMDKEDVESQNSMSYSPINLALKIIPRFLVPEYCK